MQMNPGRTWTVDEVERLRAVLYALAEIALGTLTTEEVTDDDEDYAEAA